MTNIGAPYLQLADLVARNGGFTIQLVDIGTKVITSGYAVSDHKELEATFDKHPVDCAENIRNYVRDNGKLLRDGKHSLGAWVNPDNGTLYLDVVRVFKAAHHARKCAIAHNQVAYFCLDTLEELRV